MIDFNIFLGDNQAHAPFFISYSKIIVVNAFTSDRHERNSNKLIFYYLTIRKFRTNLHRSCFDRIPEKNQANNQL